ncbi:unnamed protein product [Pleuronectes platessa]|uniref:BARD1 Zinc finger RING-type domain-containing protein n=1 Tax=Pleuronectes platessa TaxID=8262 RepID=A0A9N7Y6I0_PLEPL|nr:unnamed protein product [Pleuronectes platessa]
MDDHVSVQTEEWRETKEAAANFRRLLLCSKCSNVMKDPVCLGMCEHMVCRSCAGPRAGDGCVVCHSPAWVKDIQINRQLSSIIQLFCGLDSLLNPADQPDSTVAEIQTQPGSPVLKHKKNFKIWFSPRSRKVRCTVERPSEVSVPDSRSSGETAAAQPDTNSGSSSQTCDNGKGQRKKRSSKKKSASRKAFLQKATRNQIKQTVKKNRLEAINKQWGITEEVDTSEEQEQPSAEGPRRSSKKVSFLSPAVMSDQPQSAVPQGSATDLIPGRSTTRESLSGGSGTEMNRQVSADPSMSDSLIQQNAVSVIDHNPNDDAEEQDNVSPPTKNPSKRARAAEKVDTGETTPKRPQSFPRPKEKVSGSDITSRP